ncbi:hypothetical protein [Castellaniella sp.]|uniref:hypothetical protein n=1 Tax=Castellaniella sp. TaxID=1955812 RepID=UPI002AFF7330|nr:hypothetical protein [Castellaniella sp.]
MMTALAISALNTSISADPRIEDLRIAKALGYAVPRMIRKLIARHIKPLQRFGEVCSTVEQTGEKGGRPAKAYWLNKKQALYICTKSETEKATEATIEMVEVFDAYLDERQGHPAPTIPVRAYTRRRAKEGEGSFIVADDGLFPFVSRGDEVFVSFCSSAQMSQDEPAGLFVLLHPVDGKPEVHHICRENAGMFKAPDPGILLSLGRLGGSRNLVARHWRVLGRVIGINKVGQKEIEPSLVRKAA